MTYNPTLHHTYMMLPKRLIINIINHITIHYYHNVDSTALTILLC
jgi:hypothetical protein